MAILIDPKGLLWGKRLRKLSNKARLYYPLMLGLTNFYARIELDEPCILSNFSSFKDADLTEENLRDWCNEYRDAGLAFLYKAGTQEWIQFDTPLAMRRNFATAEDNASPTPPEEEYTAWLQSIHGDKWGDYSLTNYQKERQSDVSAKRAAAGRKGAAATNAKRWGTNGDSQQNRQTDFDDSANRQNRLEVVEGEGEGKGVDEGEGEGEGEGITSFHLKSKAGSFPISSSNQSVTETEKAEAPVKGGGNRSIPAGTHEKVQPPRICPYCAARISGENPEDLANHIGREHPNATEEDLIDFDGTAEELARVWGLLMQHNEKFDSSKLPPNSEKLWVADFRRLLDAYHVDIIEDLIAYSQSDTQRQYNWNCKAFCSGCDRNLKFMSAMKKTSTWKPIWDRYLAITGQSEPEDIEFLDETTTTTFSLEDEDDELA